MMALGRAGICTVHRRYVWKHEPNAKNSTQTLCTNGTAVIYAKLSKFITHAPPFAFASLLLFLYSYCIIFSLLLFDVSVYSSFHRSNNNNWMARRTYFDDNSIKMAMLAAFAHFLCTSKCICVVSDEDDDSNIVWHASSAPASASSDTIWPEYWHLTLDTSRASDSNRLTFLDLLCPFVSLFFYFSRFKLDVHG